MGAGGSTHWDSAVSKGPDSQKWGVNPGGATPLLSVLGALGPLAGLSRASETPCLENSYTSLSHPA